MSKVDLAVWCRPDRAVYEVIMTKFSCFALAAAAGYSYGAPTCVLNQNPLFHSYFAFNKFEGGVSTRSVRCQRLLSGQSGARCSLPLREQPRAFRRSRTAFSACRSARKHVRRVKYTFSRENQVRYTRAQPPSSLCHRVDSDTAHCFERRSIVALN